VGRSTITLSRQVSPRLAATTQLPRSDLDRVRHSGPGADAGFERPYAGPEVSQGLVPVLGRRSSSWPSAGAAACRPTGTASPRQPNAPGGPRSPSSRAAPARLSPAGGRLGRRFVALDFQCRSAGQFNQTADTRTSTPDRTRSVVETLSGPADTYFLLHTTCRSTVPAGAHTMPASSGPPQRRRRQLSLPREIRIRLFERVGY